MQSMEFHLDNPNLIAESTQNFTCTALSKWFDNLSADYKLAETHAEFKAVDNLPPYNLYFHKNGGGRELGVSLFFKPDGAHDSEIHITARQLPGDASNNGEVRDIEPAPISALGWIRRDMQRLDLVKWYVIGRNLPHPQRKKVPIAYVKNTEYLTIPMAEEAIHAIGRLITATSFQA
jgi:hypothetical protein